MSVVGNATGMEWIEGRNPAKHLTMHRIALHNNYLVQNVNSAEIEKPVVEL